MRGLCGFFLQSSYEDEKPANISDYGNPTLTEYQVIYNRPYNDYLAFSMILSLDRSIYGKIIKELSNSYSMGAYQYPRTPAKMHDTIVHWRNRASLYGLCAPPGAIVFSHDNDNVPASGEIYAKDIQM